MEPLDPPNTRWGLLHLAWACQFTYCRHLGNDPLLRWSSSCMWSNFWHHTVHFSSIIGYYIRLDWRWWELWVRADPISVLHKLRILHCNRSLSDGGNDCVLYYSCDIGSLPTVGEHVPSTFQRRGEVHGGILLCVGVGRGGEAEGFAPAKSQIRREQPVRAWQARGLSSNSARFHTNPRLVNI